MRQRIGSRRIRDVVTLDLFAVPQPAALAPASQDYRATICHLVADLLKNTDADRYGVGAAMSRLTGKDVSKYMLDAYSSEAREEFNLPLYLVPALEAACNSHDITNWLVGVRGGRMLIGKESLTAELGKFMRLKDEVDRKIKELKKTMGETG